MFRSVMLVPLLIAAPAMAQDAGQLCVNQCLYHQGPADSSSYAACIAQMCTASPAPDLVPSPDLPPVNLQPASPDTGWTVTQIPDGSAFSAQIRFQGRSLSYLCQQGGPGLVAVEGVGGGGTELHFLIDGQPMDGPFVTQNGIHYGAADPGSAMLTGLMGGRQVTVVAGQVTVSLPLTGSDSAIRQAMIGCGKTP